MISRPSLSPSLVSRSRPMALRPAPLRRPRIERDNIILRAGGSPPIPGMSPELQRSIDEFISSNKVVVFMKGEKNSPQCGFSARVVQLLTVMETDFETVNILADERLRSGMKEYSQWPTFPQVYINGEFFGGADIVMEAAQNGQLKEALEVAGLE